MNKVLQGSRDSRESETSGQNETNKTMKAKVNTMQTLQGTGKIKQEVTYGGSMNTDMTEHRQVD